ncbi:MAG: thiol:disulfide interchange protein [Candidatus Scalindua rubra]|uniref:Thiol:disulfide interchange protein n=1 Tax=Candidatus Scalindua rubra TaxID=1872076 RepID=A0A1E3XCC8_9BACT|nr:MAG: thiol:disulfide interchange protein [Candidatus Scalindua rubra]
MEGFLQGLEGYLSASSLFAFIAVFVGGVLTSFTPCVYPMIPITVAYIGGRSGESRLHGFSLSIFYVIGMAVTYSALGAFAALTGKLFGAASTNPILYLIVANIFIFLGLSMLDVFALPIPSFLASRQPGKKTGGRIGAFLVGLLAGTVAAPCTAPVLGVVLTFVAAKQNVIYGVTLLFVFSIGLGTLLILVGTFAGLMSSMPKTGKWSVAIKKFFGWIMIGTGEYFLITAGKLLI